MFKAKGELLKFVITILVINYLLTQSSKVSEYLVSLYKIARPIVIGAIMAYFVYQLVNLLYNLFFSIRFQRKLKLAYLLSVIASYLILLLLIILSIYGLLPILYDSISGLVSLNIDEVLQGAISQIYDHLNLSVLMDGISSEEFLVEVNAFVTNIFRIENLSGYFSSVLGITSSLYSWIMGFIISLYLLLAKDEVFQVCNKFGRLVLGADLHRKTHRYILLFENNFRKFFFGKMLDSLVIGILALIGFYMLNIPFYLLLAIVIMITNMIPYFGPFIGGVPVVIVAAIDGGFTAALWASLFILALQQFDGIYLGPKILGDSVGVSSVWVIIAIMIGGAAFGVIGLLLCVPVAATVKVIFNDIYMERVEKK